MNNTNRLLALLALLTTFSISGCGVRYAIVHSSGQPMAQSPMGVTFDYSEARFRGGVPEQQWLAQRTPEEVDVYRTMRTLWEQTYVAQLGQNARIQTVPATGSEPIVATVVVQDFELGRWAPFANIDTTIRANVRFSRGGQLTDEIFVQASGGVPLTGVPQTMTNAATSLAACTGEFIVAQ